MALKASPDMQPEDGPSPWGTDKMEIEHAAMAMPAEHAVVSLKPTYLSRLRQVLYDHQDSGKPGGVDDGLPSLSAKSLPEAHASVDVPAAREGEGACMVMLRKLSAFIGPGYMVAVGYMDPGERALTRWSGRVARSSAAASSHVEHCSGAAIMHWLVREEAMW